MNAYRIITNGLLIGLAFAVFSIFLYKNRLVYEFNSFGIVSIFFISFILGGYFGRVNPPDGDVLLRLLSFLLNGIFVAFIATCVTFFLILNIVGS